MVFFTNSFKSMGRVPFDARSVYWTQRFEVFIPKLTMVVKIMWLTSNVWPKHVVSYILQTAMTVAADQKLSLYTYHKALYVIIFRSYITSWYYAFYKMYSNCFQTVCVKLLCILTVVGRLSFFTNMSETQRRKFCEVS